MTPKNWTYIKNIFREWPTNTRNIGKAPNDPEGCHLFFLSTSRVLASSAGSLEGKDLGFLLQQPGVENGPEQFSPSAWPTWFICWGAREARRLFAKGFVTVVTKRIPGASAAPASGMLRGFFPPVWDWHPGAIQRATKVLLSWLRSGILSAPVCIKPGWASVSSDCFSENAHRDTRAQERKQLKNLGRWSGKEMNNRNPWCRKQHNEWQE